MTAEPVPRDGASAPEPGAERGGHDLIGALSQASPVVRRRHAADAVLRVGGGALPLLEDAVRAGGRSAAVAAYLVQRIDPARRRAMVRSLASALAHEDDEARADAAWALGEIGPHASAAVPALVAALQGESGPAPWVASPYATAPANATSVRVAAAEALGRIGRPPGKVVQGLAGALTSGDASVRWWAASALAALGPAGRVGRARLVERAAADELWEVRVQALHAIVGVDADAGTAVGAVAPFLDDADPLVRAGAARSLARLGAVAGAALPMLRVALGDTERHVRRNALYAVAACGPAAAPAVDAVAALLPEPGLGPFAADALGAVGAASVPALLVRARGADPGVAALASYALRLVGESRPGDAPVPALEPAWSTLWPREVVPDVPPEARSRFDQALAAALSSPDGSLPDGWRLGHPKTAFLRYLVEEKGLLLHGSNHADLPLLQPVRWSTDREAHGNVAGVYATADPVLAAFFAVVDRRWVWGMGAGTLEDPQPAGGMTRSHSFAVDAESLVRRRWREGAVYAVPRETFEDVGEWTSREPVRPLVRVPMSPEEFPLLEQVWGFDVRPPGGRFARERFFFLWHAEVYPLIPQRGQSVPGSLGRPPTRRGRTVGDLVQDRTHR
jgi:HEAT repeat protein